MSVPILSIAAAARINQGDYAKSIQSVYLTTPGLKPYVVRTSCHLAVDKKRMTAKPATTFSLDPEQEAQLLDAIDRWTERELRPRVKEFDHADRYPQEYVEQMKGMGLFGATISQEYGGLGLPATVYARIVMRISADWMAITGIFNSHLMLALAIEKFGTAPQRKRWLPKLASGEIRGGLALTEPDAGTD